MAKAKTTEATIEVEPMRSERLTVWLRGRTPLILNRMAGKAMRELLLPRGKKSKAEKEQSLKHDPIDEFTNSMSMQPGDDVNTRLVFPSPAIKGAMATAGLETKGTTKAQIGRLVWVEGYSCELYGVPKLFMSIVRSADMGRTPDVRTRAMLLEWCMPVTIEYVTPQMSSNAIYQLLSNGGIIVGIGDFRQEKGKGNFGQFMVSTEKECKDIIQGGGVIHQDEAIANPECVDADTAELLAWFETEVVQRGKGQLLKS